ncbi:Protein piccolo [Dissostichus eleginoides]|uniref:Protein piccolo n=1 Tax=Dissostichus eleginoides TaxID=100907 RepID=A0AAD9F6W5_DISEL|nr:Protein piccolo [Dissostichus eleginoides]
MFSSKFLSGANPLNAVSSAVNKFGLFGDDGEGDKNKKGPSQQGVKPPGEQQPGAGPAKALNRSMDPKNQTRALLCKRASLSLNKAHHSCTGMDRLHPKTSLGGKKLLKRQEHSLKQSSNKPGSQPQGPKGPGLSQAGSSSPGPTKAGSQSKAVANTLCPVCKTTELNMHTKEPPNHKTCTQCKTEVCSFCGFSPPDSDGREWLCLTCQVKRAQGFSEPPGPSMKKPIPNKVSAAQNQTPSPAAPVKKEMSGAGSPQKMQSTSAKVQAKGEAAKGSDIQKQASPASVHKMTPETQRKSGPQQPDQISQTGRKQSSAKQESGGLFGFGGAKTEAAKPEESVSGKMFGFGSSIFSSASTLIASAVQDESKTTPPVSPKMQSTKETKPAAVQKSVQDKKQEQPLQAKASPAGQGKEWLCLNCQVKRAQEGPGQPSLQKTAAPDKTEAAKRPASTAPGQKTPQDSRKAVPQKQPDQTRQMSEKKGNATASTQQESGGFFGFGGPKSQPDAAKPAVQEWLCLNCQMQRALGAAEPPGTPMMKLQALTK